MAKYILSLLLLMTVLYVNAQQSPVFSQYMYNESYWVPALSGLSGEASVSLLSRSQWRGYQPTDQSLSDRVSTQYLNFTLPLELVGKASVVGVNVLYDQLGPSSDVQIQPSFAQYFSLGKDKVSLGVRPNIISRRLEYGQLDFVDPSEENIGVGAVSDFGFDLDLGVSFISHDYIVGFGVMNLLSSKFEDETSRQFATSRLLYNLLAEYRYEFSYKWRIDFSSLVQYDLAAYTASLSGVLNFKDRARGGVSYRHQESIVGLVGYSFFEDKSLSVGYSFDYVLFDQDLKALGSHEFYVRYNLPSISTGAKKIIRTPRFRY